jgi:hypothetical protein
VRRASVVVAGIAMLASVAVPAFASAPPTLTARDQVTICHATGSAKHPYVRISPSVAGIGHGHLKHQDHRDRSPDPSSVHGNPACVAYVESEITGGF